MWTTHTHRDKDTHFWLHLMNVKSIAIVAVRGSVFVSFRIFLLGKRLRVYQREPLPRNQLDCDRLSNYECCAPTDTPTRCLSPKDIRVQYSRVTAYLFCSFPVSFILIECDFARCGRRPAKELYEKLVSFSLVHQTLWSTQMTSGLVLGCVQVYILWILNDVESQ